MIPVRRVFAQVLALCVVAVPADVVAAQAAPPDPQAGSASSASAASRSESERSRHKTAVGGGPAPARGDGLGFFTQPVGVLFMAVDGLTYLPIGAEIPLGSRTDLIIQLSGSSGSWYRCASHSLGGWASLGLAWFVRPRDHLSRGWFVQPTLIARYLSTRGTRTSLADERHAACTADDVENIDGGDSELHLGVDAGYSMRIGAFELVAPVIGASAGYCGNCIGGGVLFFGPTSRYSDLITNRLPARENRFSVGLNLNFIRVGARF